MTNTCASSALSWLLLLFLTWLTQSTLPLSFLLNFSLKGRSQSKMLAALADGWSEGGQWWVAVFAGKAFMSYIWWWYWVLSRATWSFKGAGGTDGQWLSNEMEWQWGRQSFKGVCPGHGGMRLHWGAPGVPPLWPPEIITEKDSGASPCVQSFVSLSKVILIVKPKPSRSIGTGRRFLNAYAGTGNTSLMFFCLKKHSGGSSFCRWWWQWVSAFDTWASLDSQSH